MNILFLTQLFPPETAAGANRASAIAGALAERFSLRVATLEPGYPDPSLYITSAWRADDAARGYPVRRRAAFAPHDGSLLRRALRELGMSVALVASAVGTRADVVLVSTPSMFLAPAAWWLARITGARFAWDVRDLTWRYARESVATSGFQGWLLSLVEAHMLWLLRRTDLVISATSGLSSVLRRERVPEARVFTLPNGVTRAFLEAFAGETSRATPTRPRVTYVGLMGYNHGVGLLLDVARRLPQAEFVLVGDGPERAAIAARLRAEGPANVTLAGYVTDPAELAAHYRASDVLVNLTKDTPILNEIVYPSKTFEYFATGRPVVHAGRGWAAALLHERDLAVVVPPGDSVALARGIEQVLAEPEATRARSERARRMVAQEYCREAQLEMLVAEFERRFAK